MEEGERRKLSWVRRLRFKRWQSNRKLCNFPLIETLFSLLDSFFFVHFSFNFLSKKSRKNERETFREKRERERMKEFTHAELSTCWITLTSFSHQRKDKMMLPVWRSGIMNLFFFLSFSFSIRIVHSSFFLVQKTCEFLFNWSNRSKTYFIWREYQKVREKEWFTWRRLNLFLSFFRFHSFFNLRFFYLWKYLKFSSSVFFL